MLKQEISLIFASLALSLLHTTAGVPSFPPPMPKAWPSTDQTQRIEGNLLADPLVQEALNYVNGVVPARLLNIPPATQTDQWSGTNYVQVNDAVANCYWPSGSCIRTADTANFRADISKCPTFGDWGLTYDDGPSANGGKNDTAEIRAALAAVNVKATFFACGSTTFTRPAELKALFDAGHEIAIHTWSHHPLTTLTNAQVVAELKYTEAIIYKTIGRVPAFFRPPYGDVDDRIRAIAAALGYRNVLWTTSTDPTKHRDTQDAGTTANAAGHNKVVDNVLKYYFPAQAGFISLQHDISQFTSGIATDILAHWKQSPPQMKAKPVGACLGLDSYRSAAPTQTTVSASPTTSSQSSAPSPTTGSCAKTYTVVAGDSCWSIATANNLAWPDGFMTLNPDIAKNDPNCTGLGIGATVCVQGTATSTSSQASPAPSSAVSTSPSPSPTSAVTCTKYYTVVSGDNCWSIATANKVAWPDEFMALNPNVAKNDPNCVKLNIGDVLCVAGTPASSSTAPTATSVPTSSPAPTSAPTTSQPSTTPPTTTSSSASATPTSTVSCTKYYTVRSGDNCWAISNTNNLQWPTEFMSLNPNIAQNDPNCTHLNIGDIVCVAGTMVNAYTNVGVTSATTVTIQTTTLPMTPEPSPSTTTTTTTVVTTTTTTTTLSAAPPSPTPSPTPSSTTTTSSTSSVASTTTSGTSTTPVCARSLPCYPPFKCWGAKCSRSYECSYGLICIKGRCGTKSCVAEGMVARKRRSEDEL